MRRGRWLCFRRVFLRRGVRGGGGLWRARPGWRVSPGDWPCRASDAAPSAARAPALERGPAPAYGCEAITAPMPNMVGCRKLNSRMMASSTTIQIIWAQPMAKARNGATSECRRPMTATASDPIPNRPPRMSPGQSSREGASANRPTSKCITLPSGFDARAIPPASAPIPRTSRPAIAIRPRPHCAGRGRWRRMSGRSFRLP